MHVDIQYSSSMMQSDGDSGLVGLTTHLGSKEKECKELLAARHHQLESILQKTQEECSSLRVRYQDLKADFQFNLAILDERDRELERYEVLTARVLTVKQNSSVGGETQKQSEEYEKMKSDLQCRIQELERELTLQRQEMIAAFNSELRQQKHEFNLKMDEMCAVVLSHDLKVKFLTKETESHCQSYLQTTEELKASKGFCQQLQSQLQHKEQETKELTAAKDYRIKELEDKLKCMETKLRKEEDNYIKKFEDVIQALKECDALLEAQYQAHTDQLQNAEKHIVKLQENMDVLAAQVYCIREDQQKAIKQKDETIQRLCTELETTRTEWSKYITQVTSEMVVKDKEIIMFRDTEGKLKAELERSREKIERYKQQLSAGLKREKASEQMRVQLESEWQRRCEDMKAEHYLNNEQLIQDLTLARDQAKAELKEKEQELQDMTVLLHFVKTERDQAIQVLTPKVEHMPSEEIHHLQEQNSTLRAVVTQMRKDMEALSHFLPHPQSFSAQPVHQGASAQMATRLQLQCTDMPSKLSPEDRPSLEKHVNTKQEVTVAHIMEQGARHQEKKPSLLQRQVPDLMSGGLFETLQGAKSSHLLLRSRLKQAAFCIARLSREKQQLIEMNNRLHGQIATAGLQGGFPEEDSSTEIGKQHDRLAALEQLHYQLTTQELRYILRLRAATVADEILPGINSQGPVDTWSPGIDRPEGSKLSQSQSSLDMGPQPLSGLSRSPMSSEESLRSLNHLWQIMDNCLSSSVFSEGEGELSRRVVLESR